VGSGTRVQLVHRDLSPAEAENHSQGWTEMLNRLAPRSRGVTSRTGCDECRRPQPNLSDLNDGAAMTTE
jgi:hypothetical protein